TETAVGCCVYEVGAEDEQEWLKDVVPIGRPLANTQIYILNARLQPLPVGATGDLYIGGHGLARGYLSKAELTAESFIPNPFSSSEVGARLYRTGDLARYLPDGNIEFLGRADQQVKVRGFRIELGEIEAALRECANVREAIVVAREEVNERRLIAYLTGESETIAVDDLRRHLQKKLPEYMVPSAFVVLSEMPLLPNGKVNRRALPNLDEVAPVSTRSFVAPRTPIEEELAELWRELLKVEKVGIYDHFFELGGHSLLITQLASRIQKKFQMNVSLRSLFKSPTIAEMTKAILMQQVEQVDKTKVAEMLETVTQLSPDEMKNILEAAAHPLDQVS
ncbi:MAG: phosphopantetheine-binding protein, partial [Acidobacteriota bacterium]